jgi:hypothetical protein
MSVPPSNSWSKSTSTANFSLWTPTTVPRRPKGGWPGEAKPTATTLSPRANEPPAKAVITPLGSTGGRSMAGETFSISTVSCVVWGGGMDVWKWRMAFAEATTER